MYQFHVSNMFGKGDSNLSGFRGLLCFDRAYMRLLGFSLSTLFLLPPSSFSFQLSAFPLLPSVFSYFPCRDHQIVC